MADPYELIVANQFNLPAIDAAASKARRGRLAEMMLGKKMEQEAEMERQRSKAVQQYKTGDKQGAKETAAFSGDQQLYQALQGFDDRQIAAAQQRAELIGEAAQWADTPEKWDSAIDWLVRNGHPDLEQYKGQFSPENRMAAIATAGQMKEFSAGRKPVLSGPGTEGRDPATGELLWSTPFAPHYGTVKPGETDYVYQPGAPLTVDSLRDIFVAQESGGDYTAVNSETGALGAYQVMPETGANLAEQLGIAWRPDLMAQETPEAIAYQDQIGRAAIQEAVDAGDGDPEATFAYYYGGPDKSRHGPRTRKYVQDMMGRLGAGAQVIAQGGEPPAGSDTPAGLITKGYRLKPDGTAEYIPGGPADPGTVEIPNAKELAKRNAAYPKVSSAYRAAMSKMDKQIEEVEALLSDEGLPMITGLIQGNTPNLRGSARRAQSRYNQIVRRAQFQELSDMRQASPTGGALGQVSEKEGEWLRQAATRIDQTNDDADVKTAIEEYLQQLKSSRDNLTTVFDETYAYRGAEKPATGGIARIRNDADYNALPSGAEFIGPDGKRRRKP